MLPQLGERGERDAAKEEQSSLDAWYTERSQSHFRTVAATPEIPNGREILIYTQDGTPRCGRNGGGVDEVL